MTNDPYIIWAIACLAVAAVLFFVELFVPSGGLIAIAAGVALISGVSLLFMADTTVGLVGAVVVLMCVPVFVAAGVKIWPNTPIARMLTLHSAQPTGNPIDPTAPPPEDDPLPAVGATGKALTDLRPVGVCLFAGQRHDCLAAAGVVRAGQAVKVIGVTGAEIRVREV